MIKIKNGFKYSLKEFEGYKYRAKFIAEDEKGNQVINTDIYTDNEDRQEVSNLLCSSAKEKGYVVNRHWTGLVHWTLKEQDKHASKFLDEFLKD